jgi:hypothetical protein
MSVMVLNRPKNTPEQTDELLIAIKNIETGANEFISGWFDAECNCYRTYAGDQIDDDEMIGWNWKPEFVLEYAK